MVKRKTPLELFGQLFIDLHKSKLWEDGKMISDAVPNSDPKHIINRYKSEKDKEGFDLKLFFKTHFTLSLGQDSGFISDNALTAEEHIHSLWVVLVRPDDADELGSSRISLPYPYLVPGGRFNEIYYWDSYFTMLGLKEHGKLKTIESLVDNFAWLIDTYGFIPNGSRSYFLSRSQPPFFSLMVELLAESKGLSVYHNYYSALVTEYEYWMDRQNIYSGHLVEVEGGVLNRYHDNDPSARQEMYGDDLRLQESSKRPPSDFFTDIRAACESGWDFSSRWFRDFRTLSSIRTSELLPLDLNCLMYYLEVTLAKISAFKNDSAVYQKYMQQAEARRALIQSYFWNERLSCYTDYDTQAKTQVDHLNLSMVYPLFFGLATNKQAELVAQLLEKRLLRAGGLLTTELYSGQQWDAPNGWAPLQWMAVKGLDNYGHKKLAREVASRWVALNESVYKSCGKFVEKYNVEDISLEAGGGEYKVQDGFGWSNGVYVVMKRYLAQNV